MNYRSPFTVREGVDHVGRLWDVVDADGREVGLAHRSRVAADRFAARCEAGGLERKGRQIRGWSVTNNR